MSPESENHGASSFVTELVKRIPLVVLGVLLIICAALGKVPYPGQPLPLETPWRYVLLIIGLALAAMGVYLLIRESPSFKKKYLWIDPQPIVGREVKPLKLKYKNLTNVNDLLDKVWYSITPRLPEKTYGEKWVLFDSENGHLYREIGWQWAQQNGQEVDDRVLDEVGIRAGMKLQVVPPKTPRAYSPQRTPPGAQRPPTGQPSVRIGNVKSGGDAIVTGGDAVIIQQQVREDRFISRIGARLITDVSKEIIADEGLRGAWSSLDAQILSRCIKDTPRGWVFDADAFQVFRKPENDQFFSLSVKVYAECCKRIPETDQDYAAFNRIAQFYLNARASMRGPR